MFLNDAMKMYIKSDLLTSNLEVPAPNPNTNPDESLPETEILEDDDLEDVENIRMRLLLSDEPDEEWETPLMKISKLSSDDESWMDAKEIMEPPSAHCHKIGDEARSLAARHIIDRLKEKGLLQEIAAQSPRLRSAVELLSKPDADFVYPAVRFVVNQMREKYPNTYTSVIKRSDLSIPQDAEPSIALVSLAKSILENQYGEIEVSWGKFIAVLALCGALAVDSVESDYPEGITEVVETFGCLVEQFMAEWIISPEVGGWEAFIKETSIEAKIPPVTRAVLILSFIFFIIYIISPYLVLLYYPIEFLWGNSILAFNSNQSSHTTGQGFLSTPEYGSLVNPSDLHSEL